MDYKDFYNIFITLTFISVPALSILENKGNDKITIDPLDIIKLVQEKKMNAPHDYKKKHNFYFHTSTISILPIKQYLTARDMMKKRKVWSRWGKWGACSVTCGEGVISRKRVCVSGACAPGELEEQRRPCSRGPCYFSANTDIHALDQD